MPSPPFRWFTLVHFEPPGAEQRLTQWKSEWAALLAEVPDEAVRFDTGRSLAGGEFASVRVREDVHQPLAEKISGSDSAIRLGDPPLEDVVYERYLVTFLYIDGTESERRVLTCRGPEKAVHIATHAESHKRWSALAYSVVVHNEGSAENLAPGYGIDRNEW